VSGLMHTGLRLSVVVSWLALVAWIGALVAAAVSAMNVFGTMPDLAIQSTQFAALPTDDQARATAGVVMAEVFATVDAIQYVAAPVAVLALLAQFALFGQCIRRPANLVRVITTVTAAVALGYYAVALAPGLNADLHAFWAAAEIGDLDTAGVARERFNVMHHTAERVLKMNLVLLLAAVVASAIAFTPGRGGSQPREPQS
jgi:hypothetical protein